MSANSYSKSSMIKIAETLTECELFTRAKLASKKDHFCNGHCFCCICREIYNDKITKIALEEYEKDIKICKELLQDIRFDEAVTLNYLVKDYYS